MNSKFASRTFWALVALGLFLGWRAAALEWGAAECVLALTLPVSAWMGGKYSEGREKRLTTNGGNHD